MGFLIPGKLTMTLIAAAVLAVVIVGAVFWLRYDAANDARQKDRETTIKREGDISDAINSCADLHWTKRLLCTDE